MGKGSFAMASIRFDQSVDDNWGKMEAESKISDLEFKTTEPRSRMTGTPSEI
jgi:hypothetical protein